jgi:hypothetical protein
MKNETGGVKNTKTPQCYPPVISLFSLFSLVVPPPSIFLTTFNA